MIYDCWEAFLTWLWTHILQMAGILFNICMEKQTRKQGMQNDRKNHRTQFFRKMQSTLNQSVAVWQLYISVFLCNGS
jgi:hypothetical protein